MADDPPTEEQTFTVTLPGNRSRRFEGFGEVEK